MNTPETNLASDAIAGRQAIVAHPPKSARSAQHTIAGRSGKKSKKDQLIALLSKPNGARASVIAERLGWQAHTVRAALSGLRKQGHQIVTSKSPKTGETIYAIAAQSVEQAAASGEASI